MTPVYNLLVVDDDANMREALEMLLTRAGHSVITANDGRAGLTAAQSQRFDVVLTDIRMPGMDGMALLRALHTDDPLRPVILLSAHADVPLAVEAMQDGAYSLLEKPFLPARLLSIIGHAADQHNLTVENRRLKDRLARLSGLDRVLIGRSPAMAVLREDILDVADTTASVMIGGETGTGKEVVARALHDLSQRDAQNFIAVNCAAVPEALFEAAMFGHVSGAFTGAGKAAKGYFQAASGGTLFLDEIASCPLDQQAKLLRAIEAQEVTPVGSTQSVPVTVRLISACNEDLLARSRSGQFREDLYYRLNTVQLDLPPLRERREDVALLMTHFLDLLGQSYEVTPPDLSADDIALLTRHDWPGNVRELRHVAERRILAARRGRGSMEDALRRADVSTGSGLRDAMAQYERVLIMAALERCRGKMDDAAQALDIGRRTLNEKLVKLDIDSAVFRKTGD